MEQRLAILGFHKIGEPPPEGWETWFYIPEATFVSFLSYLKENDWRVIDVATFLAGLASPERLPERAALLTFDDAFRSICSVALHWLREFNYPAVLFIPTDYIGDCNRFDEDNEPQEPLCDWHDLKTLEQCGVSLQSHGASHRAFSELAPAQQERELVRSKATLEKGLGRSVQVFSYPFGDAGANPQLTASLCARAGYRAACLYGGGENRLPIADPYRLERLALGPDSDLDAMLNQKHA